MDEFKRMIDEINIEGHEPSIEVSERLFKKLCAAHKTSPDCFTYGDPGVMVYREGMRDVYERQPSLSAEEHMKQEILKKSKGLA